MRSNLTAVAFQGRQADCWGYPTAMLDTLSAREHQHLFQDNGAPAGGTLLVSLPADDRWVAALQLYRRDPQAPFARGDVAFLRLVAPQIGRGLRAALDRERARVGSGATPGSAGIVVLDPEGGLRFSTPAGEAWCDLLRDAARQRAGTDALIGALAAPTAAGPVRVEASPADA